MRKKLLIIILYISGISIHVVTAQQSISGAEQIITDKIRFCESTYPLGDDILIANFGTEQLNPLNTKGKGYILRYKNNQTEVFIPADGNLSAPKGMFEKNGYLYICDVNKIVVYNLKQLKVQPQIIRFPAKAMFVNDLVADGNTLFASVTNNNTIYSIDISSPTNLNTIQPREWCNITGANGILISEGTMYIASYPADGKTTPANIIYRISDLKNPVPEKFINEPGQYDGIVLAPDKQTLYVTNWNPAGIFAVDMKTKKIQKVYTNTQVTGAADITLKNGTLYIPDLPNSRLIEFPLK